MKLLVSCIPFDRGRSGISVYIRNLVAALARQGHQLTLVVEADAREEFSNFSCIVAPACCRRAVVSMLWHLLVLPWYISMRKYDAMIVAAANRRMPAWTRGVFLAAVVHDLSQYHVEAKYDGFRMFYIKRVLPFFVRRAPLTVAISDSTRQDLLHYWRLKPERVVRIYNGISELPAAAGTPPYNLTTGHYLLYVSRLEHPGKNHWNLIRAFEMLPEALKRQYVLVLAGSPWAGCEFLYDYAAQSPDASRIVFTGFVDSKDLPDLYRGAALYVFPSFFEGFGLPLLEAMHYGVPCICSATSSLKELGAGAALLVNPAEPTEIAAAMERILSDPALREELTAAGKKRINSFDWNEHAACMTGEIAARRKGDI